MTHLSENVLPLKVKQIKDDIEKVISKTPNVEFIIYLFMKIYNLFRKIV